MIRVKDRIIDDLKNALEDCSGCDHTLTDLPRTAAAKTSTYGHISAALRSLVGDKVVDIWLETGQWPITPRCTECDSSDITMKDWMTWDVGAQAWVINQYGGCDRTNIHPREANCRNCGDIRPIVWM